MMRVSVGWVACLGFALASGCSSKTTTAPPLADCVDPSCVSIHEQGEGGLVGPVRDAGEREASEAASPPVTSVTVTFTLGVTKALDLSFAKPADEWTDLISISAFGPSGALVTATGVHSGGMLSGVASGPNWFAIQDTASRAFTPTLEPATVDPDLATVSLVALRTSDLVNVQIDQVALGSLLPKTARLLMTFTQKSAPLRKVSVTANPKGSTVAYDNGTVGAGSFITTAAETGEAGSVLVNEIPLPQVFPEVVKINLQGSIGGRAFPIEAVAAQGFVTFMRIDVP